MQAVQCHALSGGSLQGRPFPASCSLRRPCKRQRVVCCKSKPEDGSPARGRSSDKAWPPSPPPSPSDADLHREIAGIAIPMLATLAADPLAGLVDTAYIGRLGASELAGTGLALSVFSTVTKFFNVPLLSVTTSAVAAASGAASSSSNRDESDAVPRAASSAVALALVVGAVQAILLGASAASLVALWGAAPGSELCAAALDYLSVRVAGAPVTLLMLVLQGVFRGLQDTKTPFYATAASNAINILIVPLFIYTLGWGVKGAAAATVLAQLLPCAFLLKTLAARLGGKLTAAAGGWRDVAALFAPTGWLVLRTVSSGAIYALATALATKAGAEYAAAHQICLQVWLAASLLADSLAVAAQALLARSIAAGNTRYGQRVVAASVRAAGALGVLLLVALAAGAGALPGLFTADAAVTAVVRELLPFVLLTQPLNALAFVWDGVLFGAGGFRYASVAMAFCALAAATVMVAGPLAAGAAGQPLATTQAAWVGLGLLMLLRALTIWLPYQRKAPVFAKVFAATDKGAGTGNGSGRSSSSSSGGGGLEEE